MLYWRLWIDDRTLPRKRNAGYFVLCGAKLLCMMRMFKNFIGIIFILCLAGCRSELAYQKGSAVKIDVITNNNNNVNIYDVVDHHYYVKLETTVESLIDRVDKVICQQNKIYVLRSEEHTSELQSRENIVCR